MTRYWIALLLLSACAGVEPDLAAEPRMDTESTGAAAVATFVDDGGIRFGARRRCNPSIGPGASQRTVVHDGLTRSYRLYVPTGVRRPAPVVLVLHGGGGTAAGIEETTRFRDLADEEGFVVIAPEGRANVNGTQTWNAGSCCGAAAATDVDDVGFVRTLLDDLDDRLCIDDDRVFATGHSNGGMFAYRLACELGDRIAAVAPNAAMTMNRDESATPPTELFACNPERGVAVMHLHGLEDQCSPFAGGPGPNDPAVRPPVSEVIAQWIARNQCTGRRTITFDAGTARCATRGGCRDGADVVLCTFDDGGHAWPGALRYPLSTRLECGGSLPTELDATRAIWDFFESHPRND